MDDGFIGAVFVDEKDTVLSGHAIRDAAIELGMPAVPTLMVTGLSETQKRAFALASNKIALNAGWNAPLLKFELAELAQLLPSENLSLEGTGFCPAEIDNLFLDGGDAPDPSDDDILPAIKARAVSRRGDLWRLGEHWLACGDARSQDDLDRLMANERARMAFLDAPYNRKVASIVGRGRTRYREFAHGSGEMNSSEFGSFLRATHGNAARVSDPAALHYTCFDWRHAAEFVGAGRDVYADFLNICVWDKGTGGQGSFYRSQHELIGVFQVGGGPHQNHIQQGRFGRSRSNIWRYAGANGFGGEDAEVRRSHPTPKPVAMIADAIRDSTTKGDAVLDIFAGSGSTIMAAEKVGRRAYALEIDALYVDVILRRWEAYTKRDAVQAEDGRTFAEIEAKRLTTKPHYTARRTS